ncbi:uncharacterized protein [Parasteatoda tepidariorum]|uniref:uncharacterized protein n=1 Tax=Parasteatoda tepidariorum TaxID=114398 RepID=UPI0039BD17C0
MANLYLHNDNVITKPEITPRHPAGLISIPYNFDPPIGNDIEIYTDGSRLIYNNEFRVGCAFVVYDGDIQIDCYTYRLNNYSSVFQAELWAILQAMYWIIKNKLNRDVHIFSDSLSGLQSLANPEENDCLIKLIKDQYKSNMIIHWIKAHVGHHGNEEADSQAKLACQRPEIDLFDQKPKSSVKLSMFKRNINLWQNMWDDDQNQGRHTHHLIPRVNYRKIYGNFYLNQFITNHGTQGTYQSKFHNKSPLCNNCKVTDDLEHILIHCPLFDNIRKANFPVNLTYSSLKHHWRIPAMQKGIERIIESHFSAGLPPDTS